MLFFWLASIIVFFWFIADTLDILEDWNYVNSLTLFVVYTEVFWIYLVQHKVGFLLSLTIIYSFLFQSLYLSYTLKFNKKYLLGELKED